jgi:hypothetical protein
VWLSFVVDVVVIDYVVVATVVAVAVDDAAADSATAVAAVEAVAEARSYAQRQLLRCQYLCVCTGKQVRLYQ